MALNTVFCIDNSPSAINGDFPPSRLRAQQEAVWEMALARLNASPLNQVAVIAMASSNKRNQSSEVLLALSHCSSATLQKRLFCKGDDDDKVAQTVMTTAADPLRCIQTALLMYNLKRRQQQQSSAGNLRLVIFLCSLPTAEKGCSRERLILLAGKLRQSQAVQADVIVFGQQDEVDAIGGLFQPFVDALGEGSQLLRVVHQQQQQQQQETFLRTVFSRLRSLQGQGRVVSSTEGELDEDLLMALELSLLKEFGSGKSGRSSKRGSGTAALFTSPTSLRYKHNSWTYRNPNLYYSPKAINSTSSPTKEQTKKKEKVRSAAPKKAKVAVALKHRRAQNISSMINAKLHSINTAHSGKICQNQKNSEKTKKKKKAEKVGDTKSTQSTKEKSSTASKSEKTAAAPTGKTPKR
ncbi:26S proteasome non-ATPase regulatory subunit 4 [Tyrophagus putrescentiae]|nr:26S proteasome non-ATPase regulatory subunit 4 [Tyrophagus putrescentiae]